MLTHSALVFQPRQCGKGSGSTHSGQQWRQGPFFLGESNHGHWPHSRAISTSRANAKPNLKSLAGRMYASWWRVASVGARPILLNSVGKVARLEVADGVYAMQLSVRGNQNEEFNRVRAVPTTVKNNEFSEIRSINQSLLVLGRHPKPTVLSPHLCDNRGIVAVDFPTNRSVGRPASNRFSRRPPTYYVPKVSTLENENWLP